MGTFRVQTAARRLDRLRYAIFSCANWGWGYFNAYTAASQLDLDFTVVLGDWIYEKSVTEVGWGHAPAHYAPACPCR